MPLNNGLRKITLLSIIILINLYSVTYQIKIPIKNVKTKFQKSINKKISNTGLSSISDEFNTLENYLFATDITIGSNKQKFTILLDTGSEILWVAGEQAVSSPYANAYRPSSSTTSKKTSEILNYQYAQGKITGYYYNDQINFLLSNSFYINFGVADQTNLLDYYFDGIMGLGRRYTSSKYSVLQAIKNVGGTTSTKFSFKYDYDNDNLYFYLGEEHDDFKNVNSGILASCPLIDSDYYGKSLWLCDIVSFGIKQGDTIIKKITFGLEGLFDTGTNNIVFPSKYISDLQSTFSGLNCYFYEEGDNNVGSQKAVYCRDQNNLPKITIGLKQYVLTLGKSNFYNAININKETVYRLRLLFVDIPFCIIGQNFYYEYHTLFDDERGVLKFFSEEKSKIVYHEEDSSSSKTWLIILLIVGGIIILGVTATLIIYFCFLKKKKYYKNIVLNKELLEMSSIKKQDDMDEDENEETNFNQIMSITSNKKAKGININIHTKE